MKRLLLILGALLLAAGPAAATTLLWMDVGDLTRNSTSVVRGTVTAQSTLAEKPGAPLNRVTLEVEEALKESESRYRSIFNNLSSGIAITDLQGRWTEINDRACEILGYPREELIGMTNPECTHPDDRARTSELIGKVLSREIGEFTLEKRYVRKDGSVVWVELSASPLKNASDEIVGFMGSSNDITARKLAEKERDMLFSNSLDPLAIVGFDGRFKLINPAWSRVLGWASEELLSKEIFNLIHPEDIKGVEEIEPELTSGKMVLNLENRVLCKDGTYKWLSWNSYSLPGEKMIFTVARDITERREYESRIRTETERAEFYLDLLGHDIGNLHQGMASWTQIALDTKHSGERHKLSLQRIDGLLGRAIKLVRNVVLISRLKTLKVLYNPIDLSLHLRRALEDVDKLFAGRRMEVECEVPEVFMVNGEGLIEELFFNIVQNSYKFNEKATGHVWVSMWYEENRVRIDISDDGPGMLDEMKKIALNRLEMGSEMRNSGIGLSLVRELVERYQGRIEIRDRIENDHSQGIRFRIEIPWERR